MIIVQLFMGRLKESPLMKLEWLSKLPLAKIELVLDRLLNLSNMFLHILFSKSHQLVISLTVTLKLFMKAMELIMKVIMEIWCSILLKLLSSKKFYMEMMLLCNQTISMVVKSVKIILFKNMDANLSEQFLSVTQLELILFSKSTKLLKLKRLPKRAEEKQQLNLY